MSSSDECVEVDTGSLLPTTQPMEEEESSTSSQPDSLAPWAWLVNLRSTPAQVITVCGPLVKVGRDPACQMEIPEEIFADSENENLQFVRVSRVQFEIVKEKGGGATLEDKSMNGTYVNKLLVGKGNKYSLNHADVISVLLEEFCVYLFIEEKSMSVQYPASIYSKYLVGREVGEGSTAVVREGFNRETSAKVAMKIIGKKRWPSKYSQPQDLMKEVTILQDLQHPCITKVLEVVEDVSMFVIVMEYAAGGELFDQVVADHDAKILSEEAAKLQFYQISHTIAYLHSKNVCHRDLKLENILLMEPGPRSLIKVTDFGLSKQFSSTKIMETYVGTPIYMAPEVISCCSMWGGNVASYSCKSDCWSLGVMLYMLLCGHQPFKESRTTSVFDVIISGVFDPMSGPCWAKVSPQAKDLVTKLLNTDQEARLSAEQILNHEWFTGDMELVNKSKKVMGLEEVETTEGVGVKRKVEGEDTEEGQRTIRRKARENRKTQQGL